MTNPRPCTPSEARDRLRALVGIPGTKYYLGTGDYHPLHVHGGILDLPWTERDGQVGGDCVTVIVYAYKIPRHRVGFARGVLDARFEDDLDVDDDLNTNSCIEDARTVQDLFVVVPVGEPLQVGDLIMYPTIRLRDSHGQWLRNDDGSIRKWIGHVVFVDEPNGVISGGPYTNAKILQCHGPNRREPALVYTDGSGMDHRNHDWPKPAHHPVVLRVKP